MESTHPMVDTSIMAQKNKYPPGYRFFPDDDELIMYYLYPKAHSLRFTDGIITDVELYKYHPAELVEKYREKGEDKWYFFTPRDRKYKHGDRPNRAAKENEVDRGYWKATGKDIKIKDNNGIVIGLRKTLVYYEGKPDHGVKTNWIMQEYRIDELQRSVKKHRKSVGESDMKLQRSINKHGKSVGESDMKLQRSVHKYRKSVGESDMKLQRSVNKHSTSIGECDMRLDDWVLCKIYLNRHGKKQSENDPPKKRPCIDKDISTFMENGDFEFLDQAHPGPSNRRSPPINQSQPSNCRSPPVQLSGPSSSSPRPMKAHGPSTSRFPPLQLSGLSNPMSPPMQHSGPSNFRSPPMQLSGPLNFRAPPMQPSGSSNIASSATQPSEPWNVSFPHIPSNIFPQMKPVALLNNFNSPTMPIEQSDLGYTTDHYGLESVHNYNSMDPESLVVHFDGLTDPAPLAAHFNDWTSPTPLALPNLLVENNFPFQSQASFNQAQIDQYPNSQDYFYGSQIESGPFTSQEISNEELLAHSAMNKQISWID